MTSHVRALLFLAPLALLLPTGHALAEVLAEGKPSRGYYWQKVSTSKGDRYLCRATSDAKIQKHAACEQAGARKP